MTERRSSMPTGYVNQYEGHEVGGLILATNRMSRHEIRYLTAIAKHLDCRRPSSVAYAMKLRAFLAPDPSKETMLLDEYFSDRPGILVSETFIERALPYAQESMPADISTCLVRRLGKYISGPQKLIDDFFGGKAKAKKRAITLNQLRAILEVALSDLSRWPLNDGGFDNLCLVLGNNGRPMVIRFTYQRVSLSSHEHGAWHADEIADDTRKGKWRPLVRGGWMDFTPVLCSQ